MNKIKNTKIHGITLIALVITIIVLLILAGITINLTIGQDGVLTQAQNAGIKHQEAEAKQKLELVLLDLQAEKKVNNEYNENEYIDNYLTSKQMVVMGDIVLVDGWQFKINRNVPEIGIALGKGEESKDITLTVSVENATDYTKANINIEIAYEGEISSIQINGQEETIPEKVDGKYVISKEILENGTYTILTKDANDNYKIATANITEISEDMEINNLEGLIAFRDRVNNGATYEGKTVTLTSDIDLSSVCYKVDGTTTNDVSWKPIANFKGTFNGNNHTIDNLYINVNDSRQGLFSVINGATIKDLIIDNSTIEGGYYVGAISGTASYSKLKNIIIEKNVNVTATATSGYGSYVGGVVGNCGYVEILKSCNRATITGNYNYVAGIVGVSHGTIDECYNEGIIKCNTGYEYVGGIIGVNGGTTIISDCYNKKNINGYKYVGGIAGGAHPSEGIGTLTVTNCYNIGTITGTTNVAEIIGDANKKGTATNCYTRSQTITAANLGSAFIDDEQNEDGTWRYNGGYPILKWQIE